MKSYAIESCTFYENKVIMKLFINYIMKSNVAMYNFKNF